MTSMFWGKNRWTGVVEDQKTGWGISAVALARSGESLS